ncbi:hypothetical protein FHETE_4143 [Fusarium heterosporum]|uniref:Uncharacterized protein n=1 Tax=Fusarium heterosporum TaxID=42747 RepID=A0A8H5WV50_FUSHE|nr:hypothetical protein FHETE_4143 [Fusarium heterosporum]
MSSTVSSVAAINTACTQVYDTPNQDNVCAMIYKDNATDIMSQCCGDAKIVSYQDGCGVYCVAVDQTIVKLQECLFDHGAPRAEVFCSGNKTTTKTKDAAVPASAQASVINGDDDDDNKESASATGTSTKTSSGSTTSSTSETSDNAAPGVAPKSTFNTLGFAIGALLFSSIAAGAFQL